MQSPRKDDVWFGFERVSAPEKQTRVQDLFTRVSGRYDVMNDLMSLGLHRLWKSMLITALAPGPGRRLIDVAAGTGDIAARWLARAGAPRRAATGLDKAAPQVLMIDRNPAMLGEGRKSWLDKGWVADTERMEAVRWACGDAQCLPVASSSFDSYAIAFGLRNLSDLPASLSEARRVLKPGGWFAALEFGPETHPALRPLYDYWSFSVMPRLGRFVAKDEAAYRYLAESVRRFPIREKMLSLLHEAGLSRCRAVPISCGIVTLFSARRL